MTTRRKLGRMAVEHSPTELSFTLSGLAAGAVLKLLKERVIDEAFLHPEVRTAMRVWTSGRRYYLRFSRLDSSAPGVQEAAQLRAYLTKILKQKRLAAATSDSVRWRLSVLNTWINTDLVTVVGSLSYEGAEEMASL